MTVILFQPRCANQDGKTDGQLTVKYTYTFPYEKLFQRSGSILRFCEIRVLVIASPKR